MIKAFVDKLSFIKLLAVISLVSGLFLVASFALPKAEANIINDDTFDLPGPYALPCWSGVLKNNNSNLGYSACLKFDKRIDKDTSQYKLVVEVWKGHANLVKANVEDTTSQHRANLGDTCVENKIESGDPCDKNKTENRYFTLTLPAMGNHHSFVIGIGVDFTKRISLYIPKTY